jgi:hypothetical protein
VRWTASLQFTCPCRVSYSWAVRRLPPA